MRPNYSCKIFTALLCIVLLPACGGDAADRHTLSAAELTATESGAPVLTGDVASDGLNWFNFRRQQAGLAVLARSSIMDRAALDHANYQQAHNVVTHAQTPGLAGYTGITAEARLGAVGYVFYGDAVADGEVIAALATRDGFAAADSLLSAIYHRFTLLEPTFSEAGTGAATRPNGYTWLTINVVKNGAQAGTGKGRFITWPLAQQQNVRGRFFSDQETPDPVPGRDEVGYPVSVHADMGATIKVRRFTIRPPGGPDLPVRLLTAEHDAETPASAAAIIPLSPLQTATTYDVLFEGTVDGVPASRSWSFSTRSSV